MSPLPSHTIASPWLHYCCQQIEKGQWQEEQLLQQLLEEPLPLIEEIAGQPEERLVTFLSISCLPLHRYCLLGNGDLVAGPFTRVGQLRYLWSLTLTMPKDTCTGYGFIDELPPWAIAPDGSFVLGEETGLLQLDPYNPHKLPLLPSRHTPPAATHLSALLLKSPSPLPLEGGLQQTLSIDETLWYSYKLATGYRLQRLRLASATKNRSAAYRQRCVLLLGGSRLLQDPVWLAELALLLTPSTITSLFFLDIAAPTHPCNPLLAEALALELVPHLQMHYGCSIDPWHLQLVGMGIHGLELLFALLRYPAHFRRVLALSPPMQWHPHFPEQKNWLLEQFLRTPPRPCQLQLASGWLEKPVRPEQPGQGHRAYSASQYFVERTTQQGWTSQSISYSGGHLLSDWGRLLLSQPHLWLLRAN